MFDGLHDDTWLVTILKWGLGIAGWLFLRAVGRYDSAVKKVEHLDKDVSTAKTAIHRLEDGQGIERTAWDE